MLDIIWPVFPLYLPTEIPYSSCYHLTCCDALYAKQLTSLARKNAELSYIKNLASALIGFHPMCYNYYSLSCFMLINVVPVCALLCPSPPTTFHHKIVFNEDNSRKFGALWQWNEWSRQDGNEIEVKKGQIASSLLITGITSCDDDHFFGVHKIGFSRYQPQEFGSQQQQRIV